MFTLNVMGQITYPYKIIGERTVTNVLMIMF